MADIKDLAGTCGTKNPAGMTSDVYAINIENIATWPAKKVSTGVGDSITLDGDIVLAASKKWAKVACIPDTGEVTKTALGSRSAKGIGNKFAFKIPMSLGADEWVNDNVNQCMVFLVKEKSGAMRIIGSPEVPAELMAAEGKTGTTLDSEKAWICEISDTTGIVAPVYEGTIDITA